MDKIYRTKYSKTAELRETVLDKLYDITNQPNRAPGFINGGICSFHNLDESGKRLHTWSEFSDLTIFMQEHLNEFSKMVNISATFDFKGMWANRYPKGSSVIKHNHKLLGGDNYLIASLFYLQKPENSGNLVVEGQELNIEEGDVVIFESFRDHWTTPNMNDTDKFVIGMEHIGVKC